MLKEFKEFISKGSMLDLAVAVVLATAFGKIITSLVTDVLMPPIGLLLGKVNFTNLYINLSDQTYATLDDAVTAGAPIIKYGAFLNTIIDFVIIAFIIFMIIRSINKMRKAKEEAPPDTKDCPRCCSKIAIPATRCPNCTSELGAAS